MSLNQLVDETSPYLLQHKDNPVHWWPWGDAAFEAAQSQNKPILLSVGYAACHWCHVMAHESFENDKTAGLMNDLFINIKVDREERPDIDAIYQNALQVLGQQGGWPLTMFLFPDGKPFWGGTYFPPYSKFGRPGFPDVLKSISAAFHDKNDSVIENTEEIGRAMAANLRPSGDGTLSIETIDQCADLLTRMVDFQDGGLEGAPKFPQPMVLEFFWRAYKRTGKDIFKRAVTVALDRMCQGGIYDHLGGGFARYSTDEEWLAPHFEKMLYDNAQLISLMTSAWQETGSELYAQRIRETIDWLVREMTVTVDGHTAFAAALDADSEGEEGKFYVWSEQEIDSLLGKDAEVFKQAYDVSTYGNWESKNILRRPGEPADDEMTIQAALEDSRNILLEARVKRIPPQRDDKVLADWNGLLIRALNEAGQVFEQPEWIDLARDAYGFIKNAMGNDSSADIAHSWCAGKVGNQALVEDYANMIMAALSLYENSSTAEYLEDAIAWTEILDRDFWVDAGGYRHASRTETKLIVENLPAADHATPSGNGIMAHNLIRLYYLAGKAAYLEKAETLIQTFGSGNPNIMFNSLSFANALDFLEAPVQVVVIEPKGADASQLVDKVFQYSLPNRLIVSLPDTSGLPEDHPAAGKTALEGAPTAYVCVGRTCQPPIKEAAALGDLLASLA